MLVRHQMWRTVVYLFLYLIHHCLWVIKNSKIFYIPFNGSSQAFQQAFMFCCVTSARAFQPTGHQMMFHGGSMKMLLVPALSRQLESSKWSVPKINSYVTLKELLPIKLVLSSTIIQGNSSVGLRGRASSCVCHNFFHCLYMEFYKTGFSSAKVEIIIPKNRVDKHYRFIGVVWFCYHVLHVSFPTHSQHIPFSPLRQKKMGPIN